MNYEYEYYRDAHPEWQPTAFVEDMQKITQQSDDPERQFGYWNELRQEQNRYQKEVNDLKDHNSRTAHNLHLGNRTIDRNQINRFEEANKLKLKALENQHYEKSLDIAKKYGYEREGQKVAEKHGYQLPEMDKKQSNMIESVEQAKNKESSPAEKNESSTGHTVEDNRKQSRENKQSEPELIETHDEKQFQQEYQQYLDEKEDSVDLNEMYRQYLKDAEKVNAKDITEVSSNPYGGLGEDSNGGQDDGPDDGPNGGPSNALDNSAPDDDPDDDDPDDSREAKWQAYQAEMQAIERQREQGHTLGRGL